MFTKHCEPRTLSAKIFGPWHRYKLLECLTRFGTTVWMVEDAETIDKETGLPATIRIKDTREEAMAGLTE